MSKNTKDIDILSKIYREVGETKTSVKDIKEKLDNHILFSTKELKAINELDAEQNRILDVHIAGVNNLKELYVAHREESLQQISILKKMLEVQNKGTNARLEALEESEKLLKYAGKVLMWVGSLTAATMITMLVKGWLQ